MMWMPSVPTDNLYKFMAISGLWMIFGIILFYGWLIHIDMQLEKDRLASRAYFSSVSKLQDIERRLEVLDKGAIEDARFDSFPIEWDKDEVEKELQRRANNHRARINKYIYVLDSTTGEELRLFERIDIIVISILYLSTAVFLAVVGFFGWKRNFHDIEIEIRKCELLLRKKALANSRFSRGPGFRVK